MDRRVHGRAARRAKATAPSARGTAVDANASSAERVILVTAEADL
jgi:hypothetical protein